MISNPALGNTLQDVNGVSFIGSFITTLISIAFVVGIIIFFFTLILGAISLITAGGDKGQYELAKSRMTKAFIGLFVLFLVFVIVNLIGCIVGVNLLEFEIGELNIGFSGSPICGGSSSTPPPTS